MGLLAVYNHNNLRDFLICSNREEFLRYNLEDFWAPTVYDGEALTTLSVYHPYRIDQSNIFKTDIIPLD